MIAIKGLPTGGLFVTADHPWFYNHTLLDLADEWYKTGEEYYTLMKSTNTPLPFFKQKPDKVYLENTNLSYALKPTPEKGTLRETFILNQLKNAGHQVSLASKSDFIINNKYTFEAGGKTKSGKQIINIENSFIIADDLQTGFGNKIPIWLFGLLY